MEVFPIDFQKLFLDELGCRYDSETRQVREMPQMADGSTCDDLQELLRSQVQETERHVEKLGRVFRAFDKETGVNTCEVTVQLLRESGRVADDLKTSPALNAALISIAQKLKHHEIASYGCLREWAGLLGNSEGAGLLDELLNEEKNANQALTKLARFRCNKEALELPGKAPTSDCYGHVITKAAA